MGEVTPFPGAEEEAPILGHAEIVEAISAVAAPTFGALLGQDLTPEDVKPDVIEVLKLQRHEPGFIAQEAHWGSALRAGSHRHRVAFAALVIAIYR